MPGSGLGNCGCSSSRVARRISETAKFRNHFLFAGTTNQGAHRVLHRLNTFPLTIPPLRERAQDIPLLAEQFMAVFREHHGKPLPGLSQAALDQMLVYPWPGNIRELRNCLEYAAIVAEGALIRPKHLRQLKGHEQGCRTENSSDSTNLSFRFATEEFSYDAVRQALLDWAMEQSNQNKSSAARLLKASRKLFY